MCLGCARGRASVIGRSALVGRERIRSATPPECSDGKICTDKDVCVNGSCIGTPATCDDGNKCTVDSCVEIGGCQHGAVGDGQACFDGDFCTVDDACQAGTCVPGAAAKCVDTNACTADSCDKTKGCVFIGLGDGSKCSDDDICTMGDNCKGAACLPTATTNCDDANTCTADSCDKVKGCQNVNLLDKATCTDGNACTLADGCKGAVCLAGTVTTCDDSDVCTTDACDPATGCSHKTILGCIAEVIAWSAPFECGGLPIGWTTTDAKGSVDWAIDATPAVPVPEGNSCSLNVNADNGSICTGLKVAATVLTSQFKVPKAPEGAYAVLRMRVGSASANTGYFNVYAQTAGGKESLAYLSIDLPAWTTVTIALDQMAEQTVALSLVYTAGTCVDPKLFGMIVEKMEVVVTAMPLPVKDYAKPCTVDKDCIDGYCYIPGMFNAPGKFCSKKAATADLCPSGSSWWKAMGGVCLQACADTAQCTAINPQQDNPMKCKFFGMTGAGCLPSSEP